MSLRVRMRYHDTPRIDTSEHAWFANDQLAVRLIEGMDFDHVAAMYDRWLFVASLGAFAGFAWALMRRFVKRHKRLGGDHKKARDT